jgi:hypothetical protein
MYYDQTQVPYYRAFPPPYPGGGGGWAVSRPALKLMLGAPLQDFQYHCDNHTHADDLEFGLMASRLPVHAASTFTLQYEFGSGVSQSPIETSSQVSFLANRHNGVHPAQCPSSNVTFNPSCLVRAQHSYHFVCRPPIYRPAMIHMKEHFFAQIYTLFNLTVYIPEDRLMLTYIDKPGGYWAPGDGGWWTPCELTKEDAAVLTGKVYEYVQAGRKSEKQHSVVDFVIFQGSLLLLVAHMELIYKDVDAIVVIPNVDDATFSFMRYRPVFAPYATKIRVAPAIARSLPLNDLQHRRLWASAFSWYQATVEPGVRVIGVWTSEQVLFHRPYTHLLADTEFEGFPLGLEFVKQVGQKSSTEVIIASSSPFLQSDVHHISGAGVVCDLRKFLPAAMPPTTHLLLPQDLVKCETLIFDA